MPSVVTGVCSKTDAMNRLLFAVTPLQAPPFFPSALPPPKTPGVQPSGEEACTDIFAELQFDALWLGLWAFGDTLLGECLVTWMDLGMAFC